MRKGLAKRRKRRTRQTTLPEYAFLVPPKMALTTFDPDAAGDGDAMSVAHIKHLFRNSPHIVPIRRRMDATLARLDKVPTPPDAWACSVTVDFTRGDGEYNDTECLGCVVRYSVHSKSVKSFPSLEPTRALRPDIYGDVDDGGFNEYRDLPASLVRVLIKEEMSPDQYAPQHNWNDTTIVRSVVILFKDGFFATLREAYLLLVKWNVMDSAALMVFMSYVTTDYACDWKDLCFDELIEQKEQEIWDYRFECLEHQFQCRWDLQQRAEEGEVAVLSRKRIHARLQEALLQYMKGFPGVDDVAHANAE